MIAALRRIEDALFAPPAPSLGPAGAGFKVVLRYVYALVRDLATGDLDMRAMSLVYTTLLSLVPLCAFSFSIVKGLGFHHDLAPLLTEFFRPLGDRADELTRRVLGFVDQMEGGVLGSLGLGFLIWTVVSVIQKVEDCFNHIWHVEQARSFARRFSEYLGVLVIGPVLMVAAIGLVASLGTHRAVVWLSAHQPFGTVVLMLGRLGPTLIVTAGFTFLYMFIPNTRVRLRVACLAGLAAAAVWVAAGFAFTALVAYSTQLMAVYASFAIVLLALMWLWLNWLILLTGALFAFYLQNPGYLRPGQRELVPTARLCERLALSVMYLVTQAFTSHAPRYRVATLAERLDVPSIALGPVVDALALAGLVETNDGEQLLPGRDPGMITLDEVLAAVRDGRSGRAMMLRHAAIAEPAEAICARVDALIREELGRVTLREFAAGPPQP
jgi:membrane protein